MRRDTELNQRPLCREESQAILPLMTRLFVEGFESAGAVVVRDAMQRRQVTHDKRAARIFRLPLITEESNTAGLNARLKEGTISTGLLQKGRETDVPAQRALAIRVLISGISQNYNNILMAILGNATLIRMRLKETEIDYGRMLELEHLIQSGSFLIHMVLGYLGERRIEGKRMRLQQLFKEMKSELHGRLNENDFWKLEARLQWAAHIQSPKLIASSSARVLEVLFQQIKFFRGTFQSMQDSDGFIQNKLNTIHTLVARGLELTQLLKFHGGDFKPYMTRLQLVPLVKRLLTRLRAQYPHIKVNLEANKQLPMLRADRQLIECAVRQILLNVVQAQPSDATLSIALRGFQEEEPMERCGVHTGSDYVVITIHDSGTDMPTRIQGKIFEPFFRPTGKRGHAGLGLAAAAGILKAHKGYIQSRCTPEGGSVFKIYLPIT